jgi:hypothetical protein
MVKQSHIKMRQKSQKQAYYEPSELQAICIFLTRTFCLPLRTSVSQQALLQRKQKNVYNKKPLIPH